MCKIIVLDDDRIQQLIIRRMLTRYEGTDDTLFSMNGEDILSFLEKHKLDKDVLPSVLFVDLNMPKLSGWKFLERLKALYPQLATQPTVYILSSSIDPKDIARSYKYFFVKSYLIKPITRETLNPIMEMAMAG